MSHASRMLAQLREAEEDDELPEEIRERAAARRAELEDDAADGGSA